ncbi:MAG: hypothetical protein H6704_06425 [Myxococcales bacterium]|nr:hypothetical protein [Myxococcales bacterium]
MTTRWTRLALPVALLALGGCKNITAGQAEAGNVGAACEAAGDCDQVEAAQCLRMPDGYCSASCSGGAFDCDDQSICDELGDQAYYCLDGCLTDNGNSDCRDQYRCSARPDVVNFDGAMVGVCVPKCESDSDCEAGRRCDTGSGNCVARGEKATGDACTANNQCNGGLCLKTTAFRGGYCSARCGNQFADCEPGASCVTVDGAAVCLGGCDGDGDCRGGDGYKCREVARTTDSQGDSVPVRACVPRCQSNDECGDGEHCDVESGDCVEGVGDPNPLGAFCAGDGDCASGACLTGERWPNGYCTAGCDACTGTCNTTADGDVCLAACDADLDCRPGYVCNDGGCTGPCKSEADCADGLVCNTSSGRCVERAQGDAQVQRVQVARGVSVSGGLSDPLTLDVPAGTLGFAILAEGSGADLMIIGEMVDPNGNTIYDFQDPFGSQVRFFPSEDVITQYVPSSPRSAPIPGTYTFRLIKDGGNASVDVDAVIKTADGEPETSALDVNFFFADVSDVEAAQAGGDADFQRAVGEMKRIYQQQGIEIGEVHYCDLPGGDAARFAVIDSVDGPTSELGQMFSVSSRAGDLGCSPDQALNFFMVQEIVGGRAGYIILGIAGGIPGPPGVHGTTHSGVAVTMSGWRRNPTQLAQTMAHEGGHFLGLFHTTEAEGTAFDPLPDTPQCDNSNDRDSDGIVAYQECGGGKGAENLMFWAAGDSAEKVTGDQGFVLVRNPALK